MARCLSYYDSSFHLSFGGPPEEDDLESLKKKDYDLFIFLDQGTGQFEMIREHLMEKDNNVLILDHHPGDVQSYPESAHLNPHEFDLNGTSEVSASGVTYLVVEKIDEKLRPLS